MNRITKRTLSISLVALVATAFFGGCGPENIDNQAFDSAMIDAAAQKVAPAPEEDENEAPAPVKPAVANVATMAAPTQVVQLPTRYVRGPSQAVVEPTTFSQSGENREFAQDVLHERNVHKFQPHRHLHNIHKNMTVNNKFHTTVVNHPSYRNDVSTSSSFGQTNEVLPTTEITAPTSYVGGCGIGYGVHPGCARWLSGGFYRNCGPMNRTFPVNGPYYR